VPAGVVPLPAIDAVTGAVRILARPGIVWALAPSADRSTLYASGDFGLLGLPIPYTNPNP